MAQPLQQSCRATLSRYTLSHYVFLGFGGLLQENRATTPWKRPCSTYLLSSYRGVALSNCLLEGVAVREGCRSYTVACRTAMGHLALRANSAIPSFGTAVLEDTGDWTSSQSISRIAPRPVQLACILFFSELAFLIDRPWPAGHEIPSSTEVFPNLFVLNKEGESARKSPVRQPLLKILFSWFFP